MVICGYLAGIHPPGIKDDLPKMLHAIRHLMLAHGRAASIIRRITAELPLRGLAPAPSPIVVLPLSHIMFMPAGLGLISYLLPALLNYLFNFAFHEAAIKGRLSLLVHALFWLFGHRGLHADVQTLRGSVDVVGVNHYYRSEVSFGFEPKGTPGEAPRRSGPTDLFLRLPGGMLLRATPVDGFEKSDMNWDLTPSSMEWLLIALWERFHMPMIVTESGIADGDEPDDEDRSRHPPVAADRQLRVGRGLPAALWLATHQLYGPRAPRALVLAHGQGRVLKGRARSASLTSRLGAPQLLACHVASGQAQLGASGQAQHVQEKLFLQHPVHGTAGSMLDGMPCTRRGSPYGCICARGTVY